MYRSNKKGFTIVELVIVIAVIAILAAVLIPTTASLVRKANISSDTVVAKNLNTAAIAAGADTFDEAINAVRDAGYLIANLNAKASDCYFAWDETNDQFVLVDAKDGYSVIYSNTEVDEANLYYAVSNPTRAAALEADNKNVKKAVANVSDFAAVIANGGNQTIYVDESVVIDADNLIDFNVANATTTINLGNAALNTNGILTGKTPISVSKGTVNINGGIIGAAGSDVDLDGNTVNRPIFTDAGTTTNIDGTTFNIAQNGYALFAGDASIKNATFNTSGMGIYVNGDSKVVLENTEIVSTERCVWSCNIEWTDETYTKTDHTGDAELVIKSGTYKGGSSKWNPIAACGGKIVIEGGEFEGVNGIFTLQNASATESIVITGGTFNGVAFEELDTVEKWTALCNAGVTVVIDNGTVTITK